MSANISAQAGESNIKLFEIYSNYGGSIDVSGGIMELLYYESILDCTVRATATFADTGFRKAGSGSAVVEKDDINLTAGEKVFLKISDGNEVTLDFTGDKQLRIKEARNIDESTNKIVFTIDFYSKESIDNELEQYRVKQRYDGKVSDSIQKILKDILKTPKEVDIDNTLNDLSFIGNVEKPFYKCVWLAPRSVPDLPDAKGKLAGFLFYETYDGFKFKSIDKLFHQKPKRKLIFNNVIERTPPPGYDGKILDYSFDSTIDIKNSLLSASQMRSKLKGANTYESSYRENSYKVEFDPKNIGGKVQPLLATDLKVQDQNTKISLKVDDQGFLVPGKSLLEQLPKSTYVNYNNDEILRQSYTRYNNLFCIKLTVAIAGDLNLRAGDLLHCDFPEVTSKTTKTYSIKKSGIYMIVDLCHRITKNGCYTMLNLVRESIERKSL